MGLLKHFVFPVMVLAHGGISLVGFTSGLHQAMIDAGVLEADHKLTAFEGHALEIMTGVHAMMFYGAIMGLAFENAHYRGVHIIKEAIFFGTIAYCDYKQGYPMVVSTAMTVLALVGTIVHSMEPGVFTKDKTKKSA
jgi:hypothetical protein